MRLHWPRFIWLLLLRNTYRDFNFMLKNNMGLWSKSKEWYYEFSACLLFKFAIFSFVASSFFHRHIPFFSLFNRQKLRQFINVCCFVHGFKTQKSVISLTNHHGTAEAEFLDEIQTKVLRVFLLAIHSHLYSFPLRFMFLQNSRKLWRISTVQLLYIVQRRKEKKPDRNHTPLPMV